MNWYDNNIDDEDCRNINRKKLPSGKRQTKRKNEDLFYSCII